jgi:predicted permease
VNALIQDLRYALRQLRKSPSFTLTAVAVLALGLGANIAVFTILSGVLLRPLPYAQPDRIVRIALEGPLPYYQMSYANMLQLRDAAGARLKMGMMASESNASVVGPGGRFQVAQCTATADLFDMLGVAPVIGRGFRPEEDEPGRDKVVVLGEDVWRKMYASDPKIVGKTITIMGQAYTILGVMPKGFWFGYTHEMQIWSPVEFAPGSRTEMSGDRILGGTMYARLPQGMTVAQLSDAMNRAQSVIAKEAPADDNLPTRVKVDGYQKSLSEEARKPLLLLYGVVVGIWALACLNVTSLMLARAVARTREQAVRSALGASRLRLLQQSIVESLVLSGMGALFGLMLAQVAIGVLHAQYEKRLPLSHAIQLDWRVLACLTGLTLITAIVVGTFPALRATRRNVQSSLHGVTTTASASQSRTREMLVVGQLALTVVFLVGAGLFLRTIHALRQVPLGFKEQNVLTGGVILNGGSHFDLDGNKAGQKENIVRDKYLPLIERVRAIPGVQVAALSSVLPLRNEMQVMLCASLDHIDAPKGKTPCAQGRLASAGLVDALGIPMVRGRFFSESDRGGAPIVVVVNEAFVKQFSSDRDPIGRIYSMGKTGPFADARIVGVIADTKQSTVVDPTKPEVYFSLAQTEPGTPLYGIATAFTQVAIRAGVPANTLRGQFDRVLHEVAPDATTTNVKTIHEAVEDSFGSQTLMAHLLESFAGLALLIASVGLYGLLSFSVAQRTREIGVRIALGSRQSDIVNLVMGRAMLLVGVGLVAGGVLAWYAVALARSYVYGVDPHDGLTFGSVAVLLAIVSSIAAWLPARKAAAVDPILALRSE